MYLLLQARKVKRWSGKARKLRKTSRQFPVFLLACTSYQRLAESLTSLLAWIQELMLSRRQNAKAQARKDARAFKELDTTCQVLGINGKQASAEPAGADAQALHIMQRAVSEASRCALHCNCKIYSHKKISSVLVPPYFGIAACCFYLASSVPAFCLQRGK